MTTTRAGEPDRSERGAERMQIVADVIAKALHEALQERDAARHDLGEVQAEAERWRALANEHEAEVERLAAGQETETCNVSMGPDGPVAVTIDGTGYLLRLPVRAGARKWVTFREGMDKNEAEQELNHARSRAEEAEAALLAELDQARKDGQTAARELSQERQVLVEAHRAMDGLLKAPHGLKEQKAANDWLALHELRVRQRKAKEDEGEQVRQALQAEVEREGRAAHGRRGRGRGGGPGRHDGEDHAGGGGHGPGLEGAVRSRGGEGPAARRRAREGEGPQRAAGRAVREGPGVPAGRRPVLPGRAGVNEAENERRAER